LALEHQLRSSGEGSLKPWEVIGRARMSDGTELTLSRHPDEFLIQADGASLMSSRMHGSEEALASLGCARARLLPRPRVLVGGLGMGFTLRAALDVLPAAALVVIAELVPEVVEWNRGPLGPLARHPLDDPRVRLEIEDVGAVLRAERTGFDAVLLDVDNGPAAFTAAGNERIYDAGGVAVLARAIRPNGILAVWCWREDARFEKRLRGAGFRVERERVRGRRTTGGSRHTILLALHDVGGLKPEGRRGGRTPGGGKQGDTS
jgi:spermidine synthase